MIGRAWIVTSSGTSTVTGLATRVRGIPLGLQNFRPRTRIIRGETEGETIRADADAILTGPVRRGETIEVLAREFATEAPVSRYFMVLEATAYAGAARAILQEVS